jgi:hypothetical protein
VPEAEPPDEAEPPLEAARPIRLVIADDLARSRLTVFFRLLLAIPLLVWLVLWSFAVFPAAVVMWIAVLFERRAPGVLHRFVASYIRFSTHVTAYVALAANPYPGFTGAPGYPIDVEIDPPAQQGRWGAGFRLLLAIPALMLSSTLGGGGGGGGTGGYGAFTSAGGVLASVAVLGWFACLVRARMPRGMRDLGAFAIGYGAQTYGYALLLTDRYPCADPALIRSAELPEHPVRVTVTDSVARPRLLTLFRLPLALPHIVWYVLWTVVVVVVSPVVWVLTLLLGRAPRPLQRFLAAWVRYGAHLGSFLYMVGGPFPGFTGTPGSYPIDVTIELADRQPRLVTLFRLFLAFPALLISAAYSGVLFVVAVLGWFAALFTGRMPSGLRNLGAAGIRYEAQVSAYLWLVTDRYPYSAPFLAGDEPVREPVPVLLPSLESGTFGEPG